MDRRILIVAAALALGLSATSRSLAGFQVYVANEYTTGGSTGNTIDSFSSSGAHLGAFPNTNPWGVAVSPSGNIYATVQTASFEGINVFSPSGTLLMSFSDPVTDGTPQGLAFDTAGDLLVGNTIGGAIIRFSPTGVDLGTFASSRYGADFITVGPNGDVYASDGLGNILWFSASGQLLGSVAGYNGTGLAFDSAGDLYALIQAGPNTQIDLLSPSLVYLGTVATVGLSGAGGGLALTPAGNLLVTGVDAQGGIIQEFSPTGANLGTFASGLDQPVGIAVGASSVPEPSSLILMGLGAAGFLIYARRR